MNLARDRINVFTNGMSVAFKSIFLLVDNGGLEKYVAAYNR